MDYRRRQVDTQAARFHRPGSRVFEEADQPPIKATLPAPALLGERMWDPDKSSIAYPTREDFVRDCVPVLRREVELLRDEGVSIVQVDDPHLCLFVDPEVRRQYGDPDRAADFAVDMDNQVVHGLEGVKMAVDWAQEGDFLLLLVHSQRDEALEFLEGLSA